MHSARNFAVFLDVDGTLLEIAATPGAVRVPHYLPELLGRMSERLGGALALVSGRPLVELDRLFIPYRFRGAGIHGCELRTDEETVMVPVNAQSVFKMHERCARFAIGIPGLLVERKSCGVAVHFRLAADAADAVYAHMISLVREFGDDFSLQPGKYVYEIKPAQCSKASAIVAFMHLPPFYGRLPVFVGDDATDESGFDAVNRLGGSTIRVGGSGFTLAKQTVPTTISVHRLLAGLVDDFDWLVQQFRIVA